MLSYHRQRLSSPTGNHNLRYIIMQAANSLSQVSKMFQTWRETKSSKFEPTPNALKILVKQLLPLHSKSHIMQFLGIGSRLLNTIINPTRPDTQQCKRNPKINTKLQRNSVAHNHDISFIPFSLDASTANTILSTHAAVLELPIHAQAIDTNQAHSTQDTYHTQCEILKPNNMRLVIHPSSSSDLISIISTFLCSN